MKDVKLISKTVSLKMKSSPMDLYVTRPDDGNIYPGIIVGFELFGLTAYIRRTADELARLGYVIVVPDLYHRSGQGIELEANDEGRKRGFELLESLNRSKTMEDVGTALQFLQDDPLTSQKIGFVGFSTGGHVAFLAAAKYDLQAVIAFYPGWLTVGDISLSRPQPTALLASEIGGGCKILILVGENDQLLPESTRKDLDAMLKAGNVDFELVVYKGTSHGFMCDERLETYNSVASKDAWRRVQDLLATRLSEGRKNNSTQESKNKQLARTFLATSDAVSAGDGSWTDLRALVADDFTLHSPGLGEAVGFAEFRKMSQSFMHGFPKYRHVVEDQIAEGDKVVNRITWHGVHSGTFTHIEPTGKEVSMPVINIMRFDDGKLAEFWRISDMAGLIRQLQAV